MKDTERSKDSDRLTRKYLDIANVIVLALDKDGNVDLINKKGCSVLGYNDENEILGKNWFSEFIAPEARAETLSIFRKVMAKEMADAKYHENEVISKSGERRTIAWHNAHVVDELGKITGTLSSGEDVTERKKMECELAKDQDIRSTINKIIELSVKGDEMEAMMGEALSLILSVPWLRLENKGAIFLSDRPGILAMTAQRNLSTHLLTRCARISFGECLCGTAAAQKNTVFKSELDEKHVVTYNGISPHGHYCVPILLNDEVLGVINTYVKAGHQQDRKEREFLESVANALAGAIVRKRAESNLKRSEEKYRLIFENAANLLVILDKERKIINCNSKVKSILDYDKNELIDKRMVDIIEPKFHQAMERSFANTIINGSSYDNKCLMRKRGGELIETNINSSKIDSAGQIICIIEDMTKQKMFEKALEEEKNELVEVNDLMVNRELMMIELKKEINSILEKNGMPKKYEI